MNRIPTKHIRIWLVVDSATGIVFGAFMRKHEAAAKSSEFNERYREHVHCVRPAFTSDTKGKR